MSASDNLSASQFPSVMPASDLLRYGVHYYEGTRREKDMDEDSAKESIMARKLRESKKSGLHKHIKAHGVIAPVTIDHTDSDYPEGMIADGHHRIASAVAINPNMPIKVIHER